MKTFVKQLVLVVLALGLHSALFVEAQSFTTTATTTTSTTRGLPPVAENSTTATTTTAATSTTARPIEPTALEPIPLPDDVDAKGGVLQVKGMLEINGLRWLLGGDSDGDSVFNGAERVLPLALTLLPLLGLVF